MILHTSETGTETLNKGSDLDATKNYSVQVVLNRGSQLEIDSEKMPLSVAQFYVEKADPQFPDVKLWDKYYPALGARDVTVHGDAVQAEKRGSEGVPGLCREWDRGSAEKSSG